MGFIEDNNLSLDDGTRKIILNTKGILDHVDSEMHDFLRYIENTTDLVAEQSSGSLVKHIHEKVKEVKNNEKVEMEYMTLLERDREKIEKGIEQGKKEEKLQIAINLLDILEDDIIAEKTGLSIEEVKELRKKNS